MPTILKYIEYFVEHLKELLIDHCNPILRARYFGVLFDKMPSYAEIDCGTPENEKVPEVNELFKLVLSGTSSLVRARGLEPPRPCEHWHLKPAWLPITARAHDQIFQCGGRIGQIMLEMPS